jgi:FAD/FMN-containing dehydrogenase
LAIVPQGGNTSLVGGSVPFIDEIIINLSLMKSILFFDEHQRIIGAEAGTLLMEIEKFVFQKKAQFPIDIGSRSLCQLGGLVAMNAQGMRLISNNSVHANCIGLKVVLPSGEIIDQMTTHRKDSTGYDLKHLFIGSEGTLGIITECAILCQQMPLDRITAFFSVSTFLGVSNIVRQAKIDLGNIMSACEFLDI